MVHVSSKVATLIISLAVAVSDAYKLLPDDPDNPSPSGRGRQPRFGFNVDIAGDTVVVGAMETGGYIGFGAAYIFSASDGTKLHTLIADDRRDGDNFGVDVAISGDTVVVGAQMVDGDNGNHYGSAYIFSALDGTQLHQLVPDDDAPGNSFGRSVSISGDTVVVGANNFGGKFQNKNEGFGAAYIFSASDGTQLHKLVPEDRAPCDWFGRVSAIDGDTVVIGAHQDADYDYSGCVERTGSAYIFSTSDGTQLHKLVPEDGAPDDQFGYSVAISGNIVVVGSINGNGTGDGSGSAYLFSASDGTQLHKLVPDDGAAGDSFGASVSISGNTVVVGAYDDGCHSGSVYIFSASNGTQLAHLVNNNDIVDCYSHFGRSVAISNGTTVVGSDGGYTSAAYVFSDWVDSSDVRVVTPLTELPTIYETLTTLGLSSLLEAITVTGLATTFSGDGPFTLLAPTDDAFNALGLSQAQLGAMVADGTATTLLKGHAASGTVLSTEIFDGQVFTTLSGQNLTVSFVDGGVTLTGPSNAARVTIADIKASNGVIHVIDAVILLPEPEPQTEPPTQAPTLPPTAASIPTSDPPDDSSSASCSGDVSCLEGFCNYDYGSFGGCEDCSDGPCSELSLDTLKGVNECKSVCNQSDETVDEEGGDEDSSSAPSMVMKGSGLVSAVVAFAFL